MLRNRHSRRPQRLNFVAGHEKSGASDEAPPDRTIGAKPFQTLVTIPTAANGYRKRISLTRGVLRATYRVVIRSFSDKRTAAVWADRTPKGFPSDLAKVSRRKLRSLAAATQLEDLRRPPGNHLEELAGDRAGQHSIRVNDQWRLCFVWHEGDAFDVEIVDYHGG